MFENILRNIICATFEKEVGRSQQKKPHPQAMRVTFNTRTEPAENGYRWLELVLYAPSTYVQVWVRQRWTVIPEADLEYGTDGECTGVKPGCSYREGASDWEMLSYHDSCWREDGVGEALRKHAAQITGLRDSFTSSTWFDTIDPSCLPSPA